MCSNCQMWRTSAISGRTTSRTTPPIARRRSSAFEFARRRRSNSCETCGGDPARTVAEYSHPGSWTLTIETRQKNPSTSPAVGRCLCRGPVSWPRSRNATSSAPTVTRAEHTDGCSRATNPSQVRRAGSRRNENIGGVTRRSSKSSEMFLAPTAVGDFPLMRCSSTIEIHQLRATPLLA